MVGGFGENGVAKFCFALTLEAALALANAALADTIVFGGAITQSTADGTGPASNNPSLNGILDGDVYTLTLDLTGLIDSAGTYTNFTGATFTDLSSPATETSFGPISLTISADGSYDDFSLLACLSTGSDCFAGNQLTANFQILATDLNNLNAPAQAMALLTPLDLLEDDGVTDIHGTVTSYSYAPANAVPEPSSLPLAGALLFAALAAKRLPGFRRP